jgi:predicted DNA binding CopG/RHH family protein
MKPITWNPEKSRHWIPAYAGMTGFSRFPFGRSKMSRLDKEEQEILDAFDTGDLKLSPDSEDRKLRHQQYVEAMFKKDARINIRLSSKDLRGLQKKALAEGIPYQTFLASILHKYVEGRLHEDR